MLSTEPTKHHSARSMHNSNSHSKKPKRKKIHPHIEYLQDQVDTLKAELAEIKSLESKEEALTQAQEELVGQKSTKEAHLEQTVTILNKLSENSMASRSQSYYETERKKKGEDQILSILQFFYIVRLGQQGLFSIIAQVAPLVDIDSLTNICDQLVGSSLYAAKDPSLHNRMRHKSKLFDILHKLENGVDEPVYDGANTSFKQVKDLVDHILENTKDEKTVMQHYSRLPKQDDDEQASPTWIVMPYQSMMTDLTSETHLKKKDKEVSTQDDNDEPKQQQEEEAKPSPSTITTTSSSPKVSKEEANENKDDADEKGTGKYVSSTQEETKRLSDTDDRDVDADKQQGNSESSIQYNSESDNWRQRQPRGRGRGGRGHGRGGSGRGFIRGGRGRGRRPRGAYGTKHEDSESQQTTESTA